MVRKLVCSLAGFAFVLSLLALANPAARAAAGSTTLSAGQTLTAGQSLTDQNFKLVMGTDGNLVIDQYVPRLSKTFPIWATGTTGHSGAHLIMQTDGNLVIYSTSNAVLWSTNTSGHSGAYAILDNDGEFFVQTSATAFWGSDTAGDPSGNDKLFAGEELVANCCEQQYRSSQDGDYDLIEELGYIELVHASKGVPQFSQGLIWYKGKSGFSISYATMQTDSNFVEYGGASPSTDVIWASNTNDNDGAYLQVQDDGNVVVYSDYHQALWSTGT